MKRISFRREMLVKFNRNTRLVFGEMQSLATEERCFASIGVSMCHKQDGMEGSLPATASSGLLYTHFTWAQTFYSLYTHAL